MWLVLTTKYNSADLEKNILIKKVTSTWFYIKLKIFKVRLYEFYCV